MWSLRRLAVLLSVAGASFGCGGSSSGSSGSSADAPTISNLTISKGADLSLSFRMDVADPDGDTVGGTCNITAPGFVNASATIVANPGVAPNATSGPLTCTLFVAPGFTGTPISGTISVTDARGKTSNQLSFSTTLPERRAGSP